VHVFPYHPVVFLAALSIISRHAGVVTPHCCALSAEVHSVCGHISVYLKYFICQSTVHPKKTHIQELEWNCAVFPIRAENWENIGRLESSENRVTVDSVSALLLQLAVSCICHFLLLIHAAYWAVCCIALKFLLLVAWARTSGYRSCLSAAWCVERKRDAPKVHSYRVVISSQVTVWQFNFPLSYIYIYIYICIYRILMYVCIYL
jgi:hypothetical protein